MTSISVPIDEHAYLAAAVAHHKAGELEKAKSLYQAILRQNPRHPDAISQMGTMALQVDQYEKAVDYIKQAIKIGPATFSMYINLGAALRNLERYDEAVKVYNRAIRLDSSRSDAFYNKGRALQENKEFEKAHDCYQRALKINDKEPDTWVNLGAAQRELGQIDAALQSCEKAAQLNPNLGAAYSNSAAILFDQGLFEIAGVLIDRALELEPDNVEYKDKLSYFMLSSGNLERGWRDFDLRFLLNKKMKTSRRTEPPPYWSNEDLQGKNILLWTEQGLGEEVFSAGILPDILEAGAKCTVQCSKRMMPILQRSFPSIKVSDWKAHSETVKNAIPSFDFQYPALSMVRTYRPTIDSIVSHAPYIVPDNDVAKQLRQKYEEKANGRRIVGISWRSKNVELGEAKSADLTDWGPILCSKGIFFVNIQYGDCASDIQSVKNKLGIEIYSDPDVDAFGDLDPVIAQIAAMDLVVSTSNSNVHFAASIGTPVWSMLPLSRGLLWFWFRERLDSPWYPSARLFRQQSAPVEGQPWWPEVIDDVATELQQWLAEPLATRS